MNLYDALDVFEETLTYEQYSAIRKIVNGFDKPENCCPFCGDKVIGKLTTDNRFYRVCTGCYETFWQALTKSELRECEYQQHEYVRLCENIVASIPYLDNLPRHALEDIYERMQEDYYNDK